MNNTKTKQKGFTLIELLVVIAIIGILSSIVLVSLGTARQKARDARRQSDIRQIALAMELCYDTLDCASTPADSATALDYPNIPLTAVNAVTVIAPYLASVPLDPTNVSPQQYNWFTNAAAITSPSALAANQWYCMYTASEATAGTYYVASNFGTFNKTAIPALALGVLTNCN